MHIYVGILTLFELIYVLYILYDIYIYICHTKNTHIAYNQPIRQCSAAGINIKEHIWIQREMYKRSIFHFLEFQSYNTFYYKEF